MKLHYAPHSRAVRVAWLLEELGLAYDVVPYRIDDGSLRRPEYRDVHPMGRVPVLEDGPVRMFESGAIIQYILARYGDGRLVPPTDNAEALADYLQWLHYAEGMIMPQINIIIVETVLLPLERRNEVNVKRATKLLGHTLALIDARLADRDYLAGEFTAADCQTGHAVIMATRLGADISDKPNIKPYVDRLMARSALQKAWEL